MNTKRKCFLSHLATILCIVFLFSLIVSTDSQGAYLRNVPVKVVQPDGEGLDIFASGDEFYNWLHDKDGYTIIQDPETGYYVYAIKDEGELFSSDYAVNSIDPRDLGLSKNLVDSAQRREHSSMLFPQGSPVNIDEIASAPKTGTINNIVIFIRFSDESEFTNSISTYDDMFNSTTAAYNSMRNYFSEVSYNQLTISTTFYPAASTTVVSYQDSNSRGYYQPYNATTNPDGYTGEDSGTKRRDREHTLLKNAVDAVSSQVPSSLNLDGDGDGDVDNVCFIVYGGPTGWNSLLWPHKWTLYSQTANINEKRVNIYNFQLQTSLASSGVGVLCHEMFHSLGAPDLYHYSGDDLNPVYKWDVMEYGFNPPQHMGAYMKKRYGTWISSIPEITTSGTYTLNPLTSSTNNSYKIASPNSSTEYFMVEYRRKTGTFEGSLPDTGLLVYRINTSEDGIGNRDGPPDEVYIYRPGGTTSANGTPDSANFSSGVSRTSINDSTDPSSFLSDSSAGGLNISNIGSAGGTISFRVDILPVGPTYSGYIKDCLSGQGISGAKVTIGAKTWYSDANGLVTLTDMPSGRQPVEISKNGYKSFIANITVPSSGTYNFGSVCLQPIPGGATYSGYIKDCLTGQGISGAKVTIGGKTWYSDGNGLVTLTDMPSGRQPVEISKNGYKSLIANITVPSSGTYNFGSVCLQPTDSGLGNLTAYIKNKDGTILLSGATVTVGGKSATTGAGGVVTITGIAAGTQKVTVSYGGQSGDVNIPIVAGKTVVYTIKLGWV